MFQNETMISSSSSPVCIIQQAACHMQDGMEYCYPPAFPNLESCNDFDFARKAPRKPRRKRVCVADSQPTVIPGRVLCSEEEIRDLWLSKAELRQNCAKAKGDIATVRSENPEYLEAFLKTFQACSTKKATLSQLLKDESFRCLMQTSNSASSHAIRGLEGKADKHALLSKYRKLHVQNLIQAQRLCNDESSWETLRSVSTNTSRTSRTLARVFGLMDEFQLNILLRQELSAC